MQVLRLSLLAALVSVLGFAGDVTGKWIAEVGTDDGAVRVTFELKADGEALTGTVASHMGEMKIREGKVSGDDLTWVTVFERDGNTVRILNKAKVSGAEMKVVTTVEGRDDRRFEYTAKKSS